MDWLDEVGIKSVPVVGAKGDRWARRPDEVPAFVTLDRDGTVEAWRPAHEAPAGDLVAELVHAVSELSAMNRALLDEVQRLSTEVGAVSTDVRQALDTLASHPLVRGLIKKGK